MRRETDTMPPDAAHEIRNAVEGRHVCPFCGAVREQADGLCPRCTMESTAATRQATKSRIGPWYVLQTRNPAAPGMKFDTLLTFVQKGRVKPRSIVRGPTTHQLWRFAAHVKGLSREFGVCYSCGEAIDKTASICPHCNRLQDPPANPDAFLETQETDPRANPVAPNRDASPAPMIAEDIVVPPITALHHTEPAVSNESSASNDKAHARKGADGFLTAADLAAAFKLDFSEPKSRRHKKATVAPIGASVNGEGRRPRSRWGIKLILVLLVIAALGVAGFQYQHDANFHGQVDRWYASGSTWARQKIADLRKSAPKPQHAPPVKVNNDPPTVFTSDTGSSPAHASPGHTAPATQPATNSSPWDQLYHTSNQDSGAQSTHPSGTVNTAKTIHVDVPPPPADMHPTDVHPADTHSIQPDPVHVEIAPVDPPQRATDVDDVRALYRAAIDAKARGDYQTAVQKFEQIEQFPKTIWPGDLELRLKEARRLAH